MLLSGQTIRRLGIFTPFSERSVFNGMSYGLSHAGYDIRIWETVLLSSNAGDARRSFNLATSVERIKMPPDVMGLVKDKSSWARQGLHVFNTVIEPGWEGFLTLEVANLGTTSIHVPACSPIAQVLLMKVDEAPEQAYVGKYQNQPQRPIPALREEV